MAATASGTTSTTDAPVPQLLLEKAVADNIVDVLEYVVATLSSHNDGTFGSWLALPTWTGGTGSCGPHLFEEQISIGVIAVAHGCWRLFCRAALNSGEAVSPLIWTVQCCSAN